MYIVEGEVIRKTTYNRCRMSEHRPVYLVLALGPTAKDNLVLIPHNHEFAEALSFCDAEARLWHEHDITKYKYNATPKYFLTSKGPRLIFIATKTIQKGERVKFTAGHTTNELYVNEEKDYQSTKISQDNHEDSDESM